MNIGSGIEQDLDDFIVADPGGQMQRCRAIFVGVVDVLLARRDARERVGELGLNLFVEGRHASRLQHTEHKNHKENKTLITPRTRSFTTLQAKHFHEDNRLFTPSPGAQNRGCTAAATTVPHETLPRSGRVARWTNTPLREKVSYRASNI